MRKMKGKQGKKANILLQTRDLQSLILRKQQEDIKDIIRKEATVTILLDKTLIRIKFLVH